MNIISIEIFYYFILDMYEFFLRSVQKRGHYKKSRRCFCKNKGIKSLKKDEKHERINLLQGRCKDI